MKQNANLKPFSIFSWLSLSGRVYDRPISGQFEVVGTNYPDSSSFWKIAEGSFYDELLLVGMLCKITNLSLPFQASTCKTKRVRAARKARITK